MEQKETKRNEAKRKDYIILLTKYYYVKLDVYRTTTEPVLIGQMCALQLQLACSTVFDFFLLTVQDGTHYVFCHS